MQEVVDKTASGHTQSDGPTDPGPAEQAFASHAVVKSFLDDCVYGHHWENLGLYVSAERYDQHNPGVGDGIAGFGAAMKTMAEQGVTMAFDKTHRIVTDGSFVFVHSSGTFGGKNVAFADLMRVDGGKIVEHWDAIQSTGATNHSGHDMFKQVTQ